MTELPNARTQAMAAALRAEGLRLTRQRQALLQVLTSADDHPDATELHRRALQLDPSLSLATVYRTLAVLERRGVIWRQPFDGGGARFEAADNPHHDHIIDIDSGAVIEFHSEVIETIQAQIAAELGYELVHHRLELYCRKRKDPT